MDRGERPFVDGLGLARVDPGEAVRRGDPPEHLAPDPWRRGVVGALGRQVRGLILQRPLPLPLVHEAERVREGVVVERGLDGEDLEVVRQDASHPRARVVKPRMVRIHERSGVQHGVHVVVVLQASV